jgi:aromatic amino acid aminotransferase I
MIHDPPYDDWETCLTSGTTSAMDTVFRMFCDRGDWIITEEYSYPGAIEAVTPLGINILGIKMDGQGLIPEDLENKLRSWDPSKGRKPSVMYIVPCGQNPTGATQSAERRRKIYQVAEEHDLYIIEDDPYYFLKLHSRSESGDDSPMPVDEYLRQLPPSYLSMDVSGRVVRLDATSKILAPGLRCAWMTCCSQIAEKYMNYTEVGSVAPSGFSQVAMYKLLDVTWGHDGFIRWLAFLSHQYRQRRDALVSACEKYLPPDLFTWVVPEAGMFLWLHLQSPTPRISCSSDGSIEKEKAALLDLEERIYNRSMEKGVVISKGSWFDAEPDQVKGIKLRLTFATAPLDSFDWAVKQFADAVKSEL